MALQKVGGTIWTLIRGRWLGRKTPVTEKYKLAWPSPWDKTELYHETWRKRLQTKLRRIGQPCMAGRVFKFKRPS